MSSVLKHPGRPVPRKKTPNVVTRQSFKAQISNKTQQKLKEYEAKLELWRKQLLSDKIYAGFLNREKKIDLFDTEVNERLKVKMQEYDNNIEMRRRKLEHLLALDERIFIREAIDEAQKAQEIIQVENKKKLEQLQAQREEERLAIVKEKRRQQYIEQCQDYRPLMEKRRLLEVKEAQKIQILENESRKQSEKELLNFWYEMMMVQVREQKERMVQDCLHFLKRKLENKEIWEKQIEDRQVRKAEEMREKIEEGKRIQEQLEKERQEEMILLKEKRSKRDKYFRDIVTQMKERQDKLAKDLEDEKNFDKLMMELVAKEAGKIETQNIKPILRQEMDAYMKFLDQLNKDKIEDEKRLDALIQEELKALHIKEDESIMEYKKAQKLLLNDLKKTRQEQVELKLKQKEEELKIRQAENQLLQLVWQQNERLTADYNRRLILVRQKYAQDLKEQIEYEKILKEREKEEIERRIKEGQAAEEKYKAEIAKILQTEEEFTTLHPFNRVMQKEKCLCPKIIY